MTGSSWTLAALAVAAIGAGAPGAATVRIGFNGARASGLVTLTYEADTQAGDPANAYRITGATGTFSDVVLGLAGAAVTGIVPLNRVSPEPGNLLAPASFSLLPIASGVPAPGGATSPGFHYDNLFYPTGDSPQTATDYTPHGGFLDIYGVAFTVGDFSVNLWSDGQEGGSPLAFGVGVTDGRTVRDFDFAGVRATVLPEPAAWTTMVLGFGLAGGALRRRRTRVSFA